MKETVKDLRKKLLLQVRKMRKNPAAYASWLGSDFTRRRTPSFEKVVLILLTISCESLGKNLMKVFRFQEKAFVQSLGGAISQLYRFSFSRKEVRGTPSAGSRWYVFEIIGVPGRSTFIPARYRPPA